MIIPVQERGAFVATKRYVAVRLMESLAAWVPTTPEMEVKLLFGEHIWDAAQHADALGKRTYELRLPLQHSLEPAAEFVAFLDELFSVAETPRRLAGVYDVLLPSLLDRYRAYLERTDALADAPTVRVLEAFGKDAERMIAASRQLREELPTLAPAEKGWVEDLRHRATSLPCVVGQPAEVT